MLWLPAQTSISGERIDPKESTRSGNFTLRGTGYPYFRKSRLVILPNVGFKLISPLMGYKL